MPVSLGPRLEPIPGYRLIERLGHGGFGEVWKAEAPGGLHKAIKFVYGDLSATGDAEPAEQELKSLERVKSIRHPYILSLERFDIVDGQLLIVMELADRNLWHRYRDCRGKGLPGIPRDELLGYMSEAAEALDLMNFQHQLQHLDIKPQNLFLVYNHVKIADFGLVKDFEGKRGTITGGVTPVYAAPETCDGWVSRHSDQYSLAIVFQELLTGQRPFNGTTALQLLMQHTKAAPDLNALPQSDRPIIEKALAKKPDDRFANCADLVKALTDASSAQAQPVALGNGHPSPLEICKTPSSMAATPTVAHSPTDRIPQSPTNSQLTHPKGSSSLVRRKIIQTHVRAGAEPLPLPEQTTSQLKVTASGVLTPTVVLGLGGLGGQALAMFRSNLCDQFGSEPLPHLRLLAIDTDPDAMRKLTTREDYSLKTEEVFVASLNRPSHYLKGDGPPDLESWLGSSTLYRLPKNPGPAELRAFGRLALLDHAAALSRRIKEEIEMCQNPQSLAAAESRTKLAVRSDRTRVYIVTSLGGAAGGGMAIDLAYLVKAILRQFGNSSPEVVGVLLLPPMSRGPSKLNLTLAQTYASLSELAYFVSADTTHEMRSVNPAFADIDRGPPFQRAVFFPLSEANSPDDATTIGQVSGWLELETMSYVGHVNELERSQRSANRGKSSFSVTTAATFTFETPRERLCRHAGRRLGLKLLRNWLAKSPAEESIAFVSHSLSVATDIRELTPDGIVGRLEKFTAETMGGSPADLAEARIRDIADALARGERLESRSVLKALNRIIRMMGPPEGYMAEDSQPGQIPFALEKAGPEIAQEIEREVGELLIQLVETPGVRVSGAEEAVRQVAERSQQILTTYESLAESLSIETKGSLAKLLPMINGLDRFSLSAKRRGHYNDDVLNLLRDLHKKLYQRILATWLKKIYRGIVSSIPEYLREAQFCRERLNEAERILNAKANNEPDYDPAKGPGINLFPKGTATLESAAQSIVDSFSAEELRDVDCNLQEQIQKNFGSLVGFCLDNGPRPDQLATLLDGVGRAHVESRLGILNCVETMLQTGADNDVIREMMTSAIEKSHPSLAGPNAAIDSLVTVIGVPGTPLGQQLRALLEDLVGNRSVIFAESTKNVVVNRELQQLRLTDLPQLGVAGREAYDRVVSETQTLPRSRFDIDWNQKST